jgi:hypothetical protein
MSTIYKITYPNGKIYIGAGSHRQQQLFWQREQRLIAQDFSEELTRALCRYQRSSVGVGYGDFS